MRFTTPSGKTAAIDTTSTDYAMSDYVASPVGQGSDGTITSTAGDSVISISEKDDLLLKVTITNTVGTILPETGGSGTLPFRLAGRLMMSVSAYLIYDILKRRRISVS